MRQGNLVLRDIDFGALFALTSDTTGGYTSGNGYEIKGIQKIEIKPEILNDELYGSARILDIYSRAKKAKVTVENAVISMDILEHLTGSTSLQSGASPNEIREFIWSNDDQMPYFALATQCLYQGGELTGGVGDQLFWLWKCKMTSFTLGMKMDGYCIGSFDFDAIPPNYIDPTAGKRKLFSIFERQTSAPLSLTADNTRPTLVNVTENTTTGTVIGTGTSTTAAGNSFCWNYSEPLHKSYINGQFTITNIATGADVPCTAVLLGTSGVRVTPSALVASQNYVMSDSLQVRDLAGNTKAARDTRLILAS